MEEAPINRPSLDPDKKPTLEDILNKPSTFDHSSDPRVGESSGSRISYDDGEDPRKYFLMAFIIFLFAVFAFWITVQLEIVPGNIFTGLISACTDNDGDGYYSQSCGGSDPDDDDPNVYPGSDSDAGFGPYGSSSTIMGCMDADGDGHDSEPCGSDCDDGNSDINPDASEDPMNGEDDDCDGDIDESDGGSSSSTVPGCGDADGDGYDAEPCGTDCDDGDSSVNPGAGEDPTDGVDNDCDGTIDSPFSSSTMSPTEEEPDFEDYTSSTMDEGPVEMDY